MALRTLTRLIPHFSIVLLLTSCGGIRQIHHSQPLRPWSTTEKLNINIKECRARGELTAEEPNLKTQSVDFILHYKRPDQLNLLLLGPFKNPVGRLEIRGSKAVYVDENGQSSKPSHPLLASWTRSGWNLETDFIFGIVGKRASAFVQKDSLDEPVYWLKEKRSIDCLRKDGRPERCLINEKDRRAEIVFSSVDCSDSL